MKDYYINNMLQELNSLSRMAVIENALVTEKMISIYSNLFKYRWHEEGKKVTAAKEMVMVLKYCQWFSLKNNGLLNTTYREERELNTIFIPHYAMLGCMKSLLGILEYMRKPLDLTIEVLAEGDETWLSFNLKGNVDFKAVLEEIQGKQQEYESFEVATKRFKESFGETALELLTNEKDQLTLRFGCR